MKVNDWKPGDLPPVPAEKAGIKKSEPIAGIIFGIIFLILLNTAPYWIGIAVEAVEHEGISIIPIFNAEVFSKMLLFINAIVCLGILKEILRLLAGHYTIKLAIAITVINIISLIATIYVFANPAIWNSGLMASLQAAYGIDAAVTEKLNKFWTMIPHIIVGLAVFGTIVDTITTIAKSIRYSASK